MPDSITALIRSILAGLLVCCALLLSSLSLADTAATGSADDLAAARIIQEQQRAANARHQSQTSAASEASVEQPAIANDMAEGESTRDLPTLNEPVIDQ